MRTYTRHQLGLWNAESPAARSFLKLSVAESDACLRQLKVSLTVSDV